MLHAQQRLTPPHDDSSLPLWLGWWPWTRSTTTEPAARAGSSSLDSPGTQHKRPPCSNGTSASASQSDQDTHPVSSSGVPCKRSLPVPEAQHSREAGDSLDPSIAYHSSDDNPYSSSSHCSGALCHQGLLEREQPTSSRGPGQGYPAANPCSSSSSSSRTHIQDLPGPAIRSIMRKARTRRVPGTNRFAAVCKSWRDAGSHLDEEDQLQLLVDLRQMVGAEQAATLAWMQQHGTCVAGLCTAGELEQCWPVMQQLLARPGPYLSRLELEGQDSLLLLAPHLQQLPSLQHLSASITYNHKEPAEQPKWGHEKPVATPPDLRQLCPQLVGLKLALYGRTPELTTPTLQPGLSCLLPVGLRRLHLAAYRMVVDCALLTHLTALGDLTLERESSHLECLVGMGSLQQVQLCGHSLSRWPNPGHLDLVPLASKLVGLWDCDDMVPARMLTQLSRLTALGFRLNSWKGRWDPPPADAVQSLASLQHMYLEHADLSPASKWLLNGLPGLTSLRSLVLWQNSIMPMVGATQLTELDLWDDWYDDPNIDYGDPEVFLAPLQQLTGLQTLRINQTLLEPCSKRLGVLTQLTRLMVWRCGKELSSSELLAPLTGQSDSLKLVLYYCWEEQPVHAWEYVSPSRGWVRVTADNSQGIPFLNPLLPQRSMRPCPHLAGVLEVMEEDA